MSGKRVFSGVQPTGELHVGNYFGAIKNWVNLQEKHDCIYCIVDYHSLTSNPDPDTLPHRSLELAQDYIACGIDPDRSILFIQSQVPEHTELTWILGCVTSYGDLTRMTQFKQRFSENEHINAGLFNYPILMAADILIYQASLVPVGEDQTQHLELARRIARRFNSCYEEFFPEPQPILTTGSRIKSTSDPSKEMSAHLGPKHYIGLMEPKDQIWEKIRTAVTDIGLKEGEEMSSGVENLFTLLRLTADEDIVKPMDDEFEAGKLKYQKLKGVVFENLMKELEPIRGKRRNLSRSEVKDILVKGAREAREIAQKNMEKVRDIVGAGKFVS